jgi:hypothetical protein
VRYSIGRFFNPSSVGSRTIKDQIRVQYARPLSPVMTFEGAVRLSREERVGETQQRDRDRAIAELILTRQFTPTWYVSGGYRYVWQDLSGAGGEADNNGVYVTVGYRGLNSRTAITK